MNTVTKYMVSRILTKVDWNNSTLLEGQLGDSVRELKESDGGEITTSGSSTFVRSLLDLKFLDELNLRICRVIVGRGKRLAEGNARPASSGTDQIHRLRQWGQPPALSAMPLERSRMFEQLDFVSRPSGDAARDVLIVLAFIFRSHHLGRLRKPCEHPALRVQNLSDGWLRKY